VFSLLEFIFQGFLEWIYGLVLEIWEYFSSALLDVMELDFTYMESHIPVLGEIQQIVLALGWALLLGNLVFQALRSMVSGLGFEGEDPKLLFARSFVFSFLLLASPQICGTALDLTDRAIALLDLPDAIDIHLVDGSVFGVLGAAWLLVIIFDLIVMFMVFSLLLEVAERYMVLAMLTLLAPLAFAMGGSKSTSAIFAGWCRMYGSMCLLMAVNIVFFKMLLSVVATVPSGLDAFLWMVLIVSIVKVAKKADEIVTRIGLNPAITGAQSTLPGVILHAALQTGLSSMFRNAGRLFRGGRSGLGNVASGAADLGRDAMGAVGFMGSSALNGLGSGIGMGVGLGLSGGAGLGLAGGLGAAQQIGGQMLGGLRGGGRDSSSQPASRPQISGQGPELGDGQSSCRTSRESGFGGAGASRDTACGGGTFGGRPSGTARGGGFSGGSRGGGFSSGPRGGGFGGSASPEHTTQDSSGTRNTSQRSGFGGAGAARDTSRSGGIFGGWPSGTSRDGGFSGGPRGGGFGRSASPGHTAQSSSGTWGGGFSRDTTGSTQTGSTPTGSATSSTTRGGGFSGDSRGGGFSGDSRGGGFSDAPRGGGFSGGSRDGGFSDGPRGGGFGGPFRSAPQAPQSGTAGTAPGHRAPPGQRMSGKAPSPGSSRQTRREKGGEDDA
jgi:hypothetical protein